MSPSRTVGNSPVALDDTAPIRSAPRPPASAGESRRRVRGGGLLAEMAVIAAAAATTFWHLRDSFFVSNDDLLQLSVANEYGLSTELLGLNVFGHFGPINRFGHLLYLRWGGLDLTVGAAAVTGLVVVLLLTVLWCCRELHLSPTRRVLVVGATGFSAAVLDTTVWLDAALHILPTLIATNAVLAAHLRGLNTGRARWHVLSVVSFAGGLLSQVRPALALPLVILVDVLLVASGQPWRQRLALLRRVAVPLTAMAVIGATAAVLLKVFYVSPDGQGPSPAVLAETISAAFTSALFPALAGWLPWVLPSPAVQLLSAGVILGIGALLVVRRRANAGPLLFLVAAFLLYYGLMAVSPILNPDTIAGNVLRMYNLVYVLVPAYLALAHLRLSRSDAAAVDRRATATPGLARRLVPALAVVAVLLVLAGTAARYADQRWDRARDGHAYLATVADGEAEWTRPGTTVVPMYSPEPVAGSWAEEFGRHERLLPMLRRGWTPGPVGDRTVALDDHGRVQPVLLRDEALGTGSAEGADAGGCLAPGADRMTWALDRPVEADPLFLAVTYDLPADPPTAQITRSLALGATEGEWAYNSWAVPLPAGRQTVLVPLLSRFPISRVGITELTPGTAVCVSDLRVVRPVYADEGSCFDMDRYAVRGAQVDCPPSGPRP